MLEINLATMQKVYNSWQQFYELAFFLENNLWIAQHDVLMVVILDAYTFMTATRYFWLSVFLTKYLLVFSLSNYFYVDLRQVGGSQSYFFWPILTVSGTMKDGTSE